MFDFIFTKKRSLCLYFKKHQTNIHSFFLTSFLTGSNNRYSFLADSGLNDELSINEFMDVYKNSISFIKKVFLISSPHFTFISKDNDQTSLNVVEFELYKEISR